MILMWIVLALTLVLVMILKILLVIRLVVVMINKEFMQMMPVQLKVVTRCSNFHGQDYVTFLSSNYK